MVVSSDTPFHSATVRCHFGRVLLLEAEQGVQNDGFFVVGGFIFQTCGVVFSTIPLMNQQSGIPAVIDDQLRSQSSGKAHGHGRAPPIIFQRFAFPGKNRHAGFCDGGRSMVLGREDIATAPANVGAQFDQGFDQYGGLDGHVQRAHDPDAFQGFRSAVFTTDGHQTGHLFFGHFDFPASPAGQVDVSDLIREFLIYPHDVRI